MFYAISSKFYLTYSFRLVLKKADHPGIGCSDTDAGFMVEIKQRSNQ